MNHKGAVVRAFWDGGKRNIFLKEEKETAIEECEASI